MNYLAFLGLLVVIVGNLADKSTHEISTVSTSTSQPTKSTQNVRRNTTSKNTSPSSTNSPRTTVEIVKLTSTSSYPPTKSFIKEDKEERVSFWMCLFILAGVFVLLLVCALVRAFLSRNIYKDWYLIDNFYDMGGNVGCGLATSMVVARNIYLGSLVGATYSFFKAGVLGQFIFSLSCVLPVLLTTFLATRIKLIAPGAKTFLQVIKARYGVRTHAFMLTIATITNLIMASVILIHSSTIISSFTHDLPVHLISPILLTLAGLGMMACGLGGTLYFYFVSCVVFFIFSLSFYHILSSSTPVNFYFRQQPSKIHYEEKFLPIVILSCLRFLTLLSTSLTDQSFWIIPTSTSVSTTVKSHFMGAVVLFTLLTTSSFSLGITSIPNTFSGLSYTTQHHLNISSINTTQYQPNISPTDSTQLNISSTITTQHVNSNMFSTFTFQPLTEKLKTSSTYTSLQPKNDLSSTINSQQLLSTSLTQNPSTLHHSFSSTSNPPTTLTSETPSTTLTSETPPTITSEAPPTPSFSSTISDIFFDPSHISDEFFKKASEELLGTSSSQLMIIFTTIICLATLIPQIFSLSCILLYDLHDTYIRPFTHLSIPPCTLEDYFKPCSHIYGNFMSDDKKYHKSGNIFRKFRYIFSNNKTKTKLPSMKVSNVVNVVPTDWQIFNSKLQIANAYLKRQNLNFNVKNFLVVASCVLIMLLNYTIMWLDIDSMKLFHMLGVLTAPGLVPIALCLCWRKANGMMASWLIGFSASCLTLICFYVYDNYTNHTDKFHNTLSNTTSTSHFTILISQLVGFVISSLFSFIFSISSFSSKTIKKQDLSRVWWYRSEMEECGRNNDPGSNQQFRQAWLNTLMIESPLIAWLHKSYCSETITPINLVNFYEISYRKMKLKHRFNVTAAYIIPLVVIVSIVALGCVGNLFIGESLKKGVYGAGVILSYWKVVGVGAWIVAFVVVLVTVVLEGVTIKRGLKKLNDWTKMYFRRSFKTNGMQQTYGCRVEEDCWDSGVEECCVEDMKDCVDIVCCEETKQCPDVRKYCGGNVENVCSKKLVGKKCEDLAREEFEVGNQDVKMDCCDDVKVYACEELQDSGCNEAHVVCCEHVVKNTCFEIGTQCDYRDVKEGCIKSLRQDDCEVVKNENCKDLKKVCCKDVKKDCCKDVKKVCCKDVKKDCCKDVKKICCKDVKKDNCKDLKKDCCKDVKKDCCKDVKKDNCKEVKKDNCKEVKKDCCKDVKKDNCKDVKKDNCKDVKKDNCKDLKKDNCKDVKKDNCKDVKIKCGKVVNVKCCKVVKKDECEMTTRFF